MLYNSDDAIAVLMANDPRVTPFSLFYYGQDRAGAWPFLLANGMHHAAGFRWSPTALSTLVIFFVFSAGYPLCRLLGAFPWPAFAYGALLVFHPVLRAYLFAPAHVYGWQTFALVWAWWSMRQIAERPNQLKSRMAIASVFCTLAIWSSPVSFPMLVALIVVESVATAASSATRRNLFRHSALLGFPVLVGVCVQLLLRFGYHRYATVHFGQDYATNLGLDTGHFLENTRSLLSSFSSQRWWPLGVLTVFAAIGSAFIYARALGPRRSDAIESAHNRCLAFALGCASLDIIALSAAVVFTHVRGNYYHQRYLTPVHVFGTLAVAALPALRVRFWQNQPVLRVVSSIVGAGALAALFYWFPSVSPHAAYRDLEHASNFLGAGRQQTVVLGGYWGTYVFASFSPQRIVPVPAETEYNRMPWTKQLLPQARDAIVSLFWYTGFGPGENPAPWLFQHGTLLRRERQIFHAWEIDFWLYSNQNPTLLRVEFEKPLAEWNACGPEPLRLTVEMAKRARILWFSESSPRLTLIARAPSEGSTNPSPQDTGVGVGAYILASEGGEVSHAALVPNGASGQCTLRAVMAVRLEGK